METFNYFNYFTEIEEHLWRKRGAHLLVSPLDWAIVETWQKAGIPLDAVLQGIDSAFESYARSKRGAGRALKSLAYCVDAVLEAAVQKQEAAAGTGPQAKRGEAPQGFSREELGRYFTRNAERLARAADKLGAADAETARRVAQANASLAEITSLLDSPAELDLEDIERRLTVIEDRLTASLTAGAGDDILLTIRREMDRQLAPYRRRMTAEQLTQLERQYTQKRLFEAFDVPRLSLFYII